MMRCSSRQWLAAALLLVLTQVALQAHAGATAEEATPGLEDPPNILFITVDDLGWDSVGVYGSQVRDITPNIDRLAAEGLRFEHAHVTVALCQPSRAAFMTGRYPHRSGAMGFEEIAKEVTTVAERLAETGYRVGIMSKVDHTTPSRRDVWNDVVEDDELNGGRSPTAYYEHARAFFSVAKAAGAPFFLVANIDDPHVPFPGTPLEKVFMQQRAKGFTNVRPPVTRTIEVGEVTLPGFIPDLPEFRAKMASYLTAVHRADESVGQLLGALADVGLSERTLVMLVSDNGMPFPFAKTNVYLSSTKTPWIVRWPEVIKPGSVDMQHVISAIDFAPTVLEAAGAPPLKGIDGRSFVPLLQQQPQGGRDFAFTFLYETLGGNPLPMRSIVGRRYGYIYNGWSDGTSSSRKRVEFGAGMRAMIAAARNDEALAARLAFLQYRTPEELYDYAADPAALQNLVDAPEFHSRVVEYRERIVEAMRVTGDPLLTQFEARIRAHPVSSAAGEASP